MSQTRRLAAILAADVAGYSRLIGVDEGRTLRQLKAIRAELIDPKIAEHHGRLVKTTGDGLLVEPAVWLMGCAVRLSCRPARPSATPRSPPTSASSSVSASTWATSCRGTATSSSTG